VKFRFYVDPDSQEPHIYKHQVTEQEIVEIFTARSYFERLRADGSYELIARLRSARCLRVAYRKFDSNGIFVITAYDIIDREVIQFLEDNYEDN